MTDEEIMLYIGPEAVKRAEDLGKQMKSPQWTHWALMEELRIKQKWGSYERFKIFDNWRKSNLKRFNTTEPTGDLTQVDIYELIEREKRAILTPNGGLQ